MADIKKKCSQCNKDFLVVEPEQKFLKKKGLPLPENCPTCRQARRLALRSQRKLIRAQCDQCNKEFVTTLDPSSKQKVYCRECYQDYYNKVDPIITDPLPE
ncbi:zinc-ribbon domain-containing protein [Patescibacteria group bacterium]|nr:zinc-ribbon domain-containing protein [Patescibacteria group bacterium]MBU1931316.1 zinc-ribbon domain-containing protein [Patescibacteria group bacterium]